MEIEETCKIIRVPYGYCTIILEGLQGKEYYLTEENGGLTIEVMDQEFECMKDESGDIS